MSQPTGSSTMQASSRSTEKGAPGPLPDKYYGQLPDWDFELWPNRTAVIMAALFLALGFTVNMQITERIDTLMWGGISPLWGLFFFALWNASGAMFFGLPGALIIANVNPIVANLTATNPLAPVFFATNSLYAVPMAFWTWYFKEDGEGLTFRQVATAHILSIPLAVVPLAFVWVFVLQLTMPVVAMWFAASCIAGWLGIFLAYPFAKKLLTAGVIPQ